MIFNQTILSQDTLMKHIVMISVNETLLINNGVVANSENHFQALRISFKLHFNVLKIILVFSISC